MTELVEQEYIDILQKADELGISLPDGIVLLPRNFETASAVNTLVHESTVNTVNKLLANEHVPNSVLQLEDQSIPQLEARSFDWIAPLIYVPNQVITQNPFWISAAVNILCNYLTQHFPKSLSKKQDVTITVVYEKTKDKTFAKLEYKGTADGVSDFAGLVEKVFPKGVK